MAELAFVTSRSHRMGNHHGEISWKLQREQFSGQNVILLGGAKLESQSLSQPSQPALAPTMAFPAIETEVCNIEMLSHVKRLH